MPYPSFFNPDPSIPDADLLGYGDLIFDDGSSQYIPGDPEAISGLQPQPQMGPPLPPMGPPETPIIQNDAGESFQVGLDGNITPVTDPMTGQQVPQQDASGASDFGDLIRGAGDALEVPPMQQFGSEPPAAAGGPQPITMPNDQGQPVTIYPDGRIEPGANGIPIEQAQQQSPMGMMPVERQGALDPAVAQRQAAEMGAMNEQTLGATQQARADEVRMYNELVLKQMAANEADKVRQEQEIAEQQAKVERWQREQQQTMDMQIETDLVSARGPIGAALGVLGAMLLGGAGSDAGLRMIDKSIDQHVRLQVGRRDAKLGMLAEQIGSSQQAIKMGKAALYKTAADRLELLAAKTKNDVYEAQSPAVVQQLRQKQMENMQAAERDSLGKTIERMPVPPKPPSQEMLQKYGELRRERAGNESITQRMDQTLGLVWAPGQNGQPGRYINKDEVVKRGIQGTGNLEQLIPDIVYATGGGMTAEGRQVRGAAEAMAFAQLRAVQPTGPISNSDIERAVKIGALDTEEGLLLGLERMHNAAEQQRAMDVQQFGPDVVTEFERRGGGPNAPAQPAASRPASLSELRDGAQRSRGGGQPQASGESVAAQMPPEQRMAQVREDLQVIVGQELPPEGLAILASQAALESGNGDSQGAANANMFGHKQTAGRKGFQANTTEGEDGRPTRANFAAYDTIAAGVADHISLLKRRYPRAWEALEVGDPDAYVAALKDGGYFTANEERYRQGILRGL